MPIPPRCATSPSASPARPMCSRWPRGRCRSRKRRRSADRSRMGRRQPARLRAARRDVSAAARRVADHRPRSRRPSSPLARARKRTGGRRRRVRAHAGRRLRGVLRHARRMVPADPRGLTLEQAASLPENSSPSGTTCSTADALRRGETLLVHGGTSGIGLDSDPDREGVRRDGDHDSGQRGKGGVLSRHRRRPRDRLQDAGLRAEVARITGKRGVDVILDMVGGDYIEKNLKCLALEGRLVRSHS